MIKFTTKDDNKQFISIVIKDYTSTKRLFNYLCGLYSSLALCDYKMDKNEIIFNIADNVKYGFSLKELKQTINRITNATVRCFCVYLSEPTQRYP